jgi:voltage-gated potassium channel
MQDNEKQISQLRSDLSIFKTVVIAFIAVVTTSTIFFHLVERWKWLDSFYFTIVTISTIGYGNLIPDSDVGKIGNIVLIILGLGVFSVFINQLVKRQGLRRLEKKNKR